MRILHFYKTYYPETMGGIEQVINQLACSAAALGVQTDVLSLCRSKTNCVKINGHNSFQVRMNFEIASAGFSAGVFSKFKELANQADVIHYHYPWPFMDMVHFITQVKKPTVLTYHSDIIKQKYWAKLYKPLQHCFLKSVDRIIATSPNYLQSSTVLSGYLNKIKVIPIGIDSATYPVPLPSVLDKWHKFTQQRFFLFVGMLRYYKGLHLLLEAIQKNQYPLIIVGTGPMETALKQQAIKLKLNNVHFLGALSDEDKVALLMLSYAVVFPSNMRSEAFGISLLEGAMYGKPLISCEINTGTSYINQHNVTGLVIPPNDASALSHAMQTLWENPAMSESMGEQAALRHSQLFTAKQMATNYMNIYNEVLDQ